MNLTSTDIIIFIVFSLLLLKGFWQGFVRALIGPLACVIAVMTAWLLWVTTKNWYLSFLTLTLGQIMLSWAMGLAIRAFDHAFPPNPPLISRILGAGISLVWGSVWVILITAFLMLLPSQVMDIGKTQDDIRASQYYRIVALYIPIFPGTAEDCGREACYAGPEKVMASLSTGNVAPLLNDPRVKELLRDPEFMSASQNRDYAKVFNNPKLQVLIKDPRFIMNALRAYPQIRHDLEKARAENPDNP
ncbi:MAG: hypothetical protein HQL19_01270 [Candidatus Omnitrophica bacterium]|nr:hypothetical protein [Candidatus Omnitrophota bacterium]